MHFVKQFSINGVDTKQVACIELQGPPNAATEGAVGVLGMDMTSPTHEVYRCVAVNGSIYTWELLSAGMSIISATLTGEGGETMTFPYSNLRIPSNYLIKMGDLILDSEGYLYQINSIGVESCNASYCGTHIGGIASGDKDFRLAVKDGKLQLVTESGNVVSNVDYTSADGDTIYRNESTGALSVKGIKTIDGTSLKLFVGTYEEYINLTEVQKRNLFAIVTDDNTMNLVLEAVAELRESLQNGDFVVESAIRAESAESASVIKSPIVYCYIENAVGEVNLTPNSVYAIRIHQDIYTVFVDENGEGFSSLAVDGSYVTCSWDKTRSRGYITYYHEDGDPNPEECTASIVKIFDGN